MKRRKKIVFLLLFVLMPYTMWAQDKANMFNPIRNSVTSQTIAPVSIYVCRRIWRNGMHMNATKFTTGTKLLVRVKSTVSRRPSYPCAVHRSPE